MQDVALVMAGALGALVAIFHAVIVRRKMHATLAPTLSDTSLVPPPIARLVPLLLDFSGYNWFVGGVALATSPFWLNDQAIIAIALFVGSSYIFAAIGNFYGTRGKHPGWVLYAISMILLVYGAWRPMA